MGVYNLQSNKLTIVLTDETIDQAQDDENPNPNKIIIPSEDWEDIYSSTVEDQPWWDQIEINVEDVIYDFAETTLNQNGYYELVQNEDGDYYPRLIENYQEGDDYDIRINIPIPEPPPQPVIGNVSITTNGQYLPGDFNPQGIYDPLNPNNNFDYLNQVNVQVQPTSSKKTLNLTQNTSSAQTIYPPTGEYWNSIEYSVNVQPTSSQKTLNLTQNTTTPQTIYPPTGEYWSSIQYSVNVQPPTPTVGAANITENGQYSPEDFGNYQYIDQINVLVKNKLKISRYVRIKGENNEIFSNYFALTYYPNGNTRTLYQYNSYVYIVPKTNYINIYFMSDVAYDASFTIAPGGWFGGITGHIDSYSDLILYKYNGTSTPSEAVLSLRDVGTGGADNVNNWSFLQIYQPLCQITIQ